MTERVINNRRKSVLLVFSNHVEENKLEDLAKQKLICGKFLTTKTGWIKLFSILILVVGLAFFFSAGKCVQSSPWFAYLYPISAGTCLGVQILFYLFFSSGVAAKRPGLFVKYDIILNVLLSIALLISVIMSVNDCNELQFQSISYYVSISSVVLSMTGCAALLLFYRYHDEFDESVEQSPVESFPRKSMFI